MTAVFLPPLVQLLGRRAALALLLASAIVASSAVAQKNDPQPRAESAVTGAAPSQSPAAAHTSPAETGRGEVSVTELARRPDGSVQLRLVFRNTSDRSMSLSTVDHLWGVRLIDLRGGRSYGVIQQGSAGPMASNFGSTILNPGEERTAWARFGGLPDTVRDVTVQIRGFEPVEAVPVAR